MSRMVYFLNTYIILIYLSVIESLRGTSQIFIPGNTGNEILPPILEVETLKANNKMKQTNVNKDKYIDWRAVNITTSINPNTTGFNNMTAINPVIVLDFSTSESSKFQLGITKVTSC
jgi:hypothetical protein